jgi:hypothetical protein
VKKEDRYQSAGEMREALEKAAFDAGLRLSQSSLTGYVTKEGEITATGGSRSSLTPAHSVPAQKAVSSAGTLPRAQAKRAATVSERRPAPKKPPLVLAGILFAAALAIGVFGVLLVFGGKEAPPPVAPTPVVVTPVVVTPPPAPAPAPAPVPRPLVVPPLSAVVEPPPPPAPAPVPKPLPKPVPVRLAPDEPVRPARPVHAERPEPKPPPEEAAPVIPAGEGKLRISATNPSAVTAVLVGGEDWGSPPVNKKVSSGLYVVTVKLADGKRSVPWKGAVQPDKTTALVYDVTGGKWTAQ